MKKIGRENLATRVLPVDWSLNIDYVPFEFGYKVQYAIKDERGVTLYLYNIKVYYEGDDHLVRIWLEVLKEISENLKCEFSALHIIDVKSNFFAICEAGELFDDKGNPNSVDYFMVE